MRDLLRGLALLAVVVVLAAIVWSCKAHAEQQAGEAVAICKPHAVMLTRLAGLHEHVVARGVVTDEGDAIGVPVALMEITAGDGGSWTLVLTDPEDGNACMVASGGHFKLEKPMPGDPT